MYEGNFKNRDIKGKFIKLENIKPGDIFETNMNGKLIILNEIKFTLGKNGMEPVDNSKNRYYCVQFLATGYCTVANLTNIKKGVVKDLWAPRIAGVGYLGANIHPKQSQYIRFYASWLKMIKRCYNVNDPDYPEYGAIGVKVDPYWHCFMNYYDDMKYLPNFEKKLMYPEVYQIDKDYLQFNVPKSQRIYSKNTCMFLSKFDNIQVRNRERTLELGNKYFGVIKNVDKFNKSRITSYTTEITLFDDFGKSQGSISAANFTSEFAAASLFNHIYPFITRNVPFHEINILNNINPIPYDELINHVSTRKPHDWFNDYPTWSTVLANWK